MLNHTLVLVNAHSCEFCKGLNDSLPGSGLHARPSNSTCRVANTFDSDVRFRRDGVSVDGKSVMDLLTLSLAPGVGFSVQIEGADEAVAIEEMARHFVHGIPEEKCPGFLRFVANLELTAGQNFETMNPLTALTAFTKDLLARGVCQWKAMP